MSETNEKIIAIFFVELFVQNVWSVFWAFQKMRNVLNPIFVFMSFFSAIFSF